MFLKSLKKISAITDKLGFVKMELYNDLMELHGESDIGSAKETLEIKHNGPDNTMNFNLRFLFDVANHTEGEHLLMKLPEKSGAVLFISKDDDTYKNIVMPVRL